MDTKHTPLPWTYQFEQGNDWGLITAGKSGPIIANVNSESCPDIQSAPCFRVMPKEANAAFICHAVNNHYELLEACKVAEDCIRKIPAFGDSIGTEISKAQLGVAYNRLTTAIAHAEGTQQ